MRQAHRDGLTGLLNKRSFEARLAEEAERLSARDRPLGLILLDLDRFKAVNDEHGHPVGDRVPAEAAGRIAAEARAIDSVGRIGGEEFAWLLPDASAAETLAAAERLRAAVRSRPFAQGLTLTASIGICDLACAPAPEQLLERADQALYWAKTTGRAWPPPAVGSASSARRARTSTRQARLHRAARVHDAGKALLSTDVLRRPGPLSTLESAHVRQHATLGAALARGALDAEQVRWVRHHHERWDGAGYPTGRPAKTSPAAPGSWRSPTPGTP